MENVAPRSVVLFVIRLYRPSREKLMRSPKQRVRGGAADEIVRLSFSGFLGIAGKLESLPLNGVAGLLILVRQLPLATRGSVAGGR